MYLIQFFLKNLKNHQLVKWLKSSSLRFKTQKLIFMKIKIIKKSLKSKMSIKQKLKHQSSWSSCKKHLNQSNKEL